MKTDLLEVRGLKKYFPVKAGFWQRKISHLKAVDHVSFTVMKGETFGLVGESGCGKSTTGRTIMRLLEPTGGEVRFLGRNIFELSQEEMRGIRKEMQMVFQDPLASLNPRHTVQRILEEPLVVHRIGTAKERKERVAGLIEAVGLDPRHAFRYPHQFSGGQRQRIGIARALALRPKLIVADEPVSALDVSVQAQVINLFEDLQHQFDLTYIFISHNLSVVRHICNRVGVMYLGRMVEIAHANTLFNEPLHPYTQALLASVPSADPDVPRERIVLQGEIPNPAAAPDGCAFHARCPVAMEICRNRRPELKKYGDNRYAACHLYA